MLENIFIDNAAGRKNWRKWLTFSLSLFIHAALFAAMIVVPLLQAEAKMPEFKFTKIFIAPPIPGVPPAGSGGRGHARIAKPGKENSRGISAGKPMTFRVPVDIPTTIEEDPTATLDEPGSKPGVVGGQGNGESPWEMGDQLQPEIVSSDVVRVGSVQIPRLVKRVNPIYPPMAIIARVSGVVVVEASTDIYGRVQNARIISGNALFHDESLAAVRQWVYEPYLINAIPRPVVFTVTITFSLETR
jgi:protein TonB